MCLLGKVLMTLCGVKRLGWKRYWPMKFFMRDCGSVLQASSIVKTQKLLQLDPIHCCVTYSFFGFPRSVTHTAGNERFSTVLCFEVAQQVEG